MGGMWLPNADLTGDNFSLACQLLRWSPAQVAIDCGYGRRSASYWISSERVIPPEVEMWLTQRLVGNLIEPLPR
jgi:hypothetical protein